MSRLLRIALIAAAALAVLMALRQTWRQHHQAAGLDFYIYWVNSQLDERDDVDDIYSAETQERIGEEYYARAQSETSELQRYDAGRRRRLDNVSSPFLYTALSWVDANYERARGEFLVAVTVAFAAGTLLFCRSFGLSWPASLFLLAALLTWYRGFEADLRVGNVNSLQLFAFGAMVALETRASRPGRRSAALRFAAAAIGGMLLLFKPNFLYALLLVLGARAIAGEWRKLRVELAGGLAGGVAALAAAAVNYGSARVWLQWPAAATQFWHRLQTRGERNVAPALELFERYGTWLSHVIAILLIAIVCVAAWRGRRRIDAPLVASTGVLIYLMASTVVWLHYMVLALPVAVALMRWRTTGAVALVSLAAIAEEPFEMLTGKAVYPFDARLITPALVALYVCAVWKIARPSDENPDPSLG